MINYKLKEEYKQIKDQFFDFVRFFVKFFVRFFLVTEILAAVKLVEELTTLR